MWYNVLTLGKDSSDRRCYDNYKDYTADQDHYLLLQRAKSQKRGGVSESNKIGFWLKKKKGGGELWESCMIRAWLELIISSFCKFETNSYIIEKASIKFILQCWVVDGKPIYMLACPIPMLVISLEFPILTQGATHENDGVTPY